MTTLKVNTIGSTGPGDRLLVLLHGYGADGNDLFGLSTPLADYMPDTVFRSPNAPERSTVNLMGYQWFPIPWLDGSTEEQRDQSFRKMRWRFTGISVPLFTRLVTPDVRFSNRFSNLLVAFFG